MSYETEHIFQKKKYKWLVKFFDMFNIRKIQIKIVGGGGVKENYVVIPLHFPLLTCPQRSEGGIESHGTGVRGCCETPCWCWDQTQILYESNKCSYLLSPLSSPKRFFCHIYILDSSSILILTG